MALATITVATSSAAGGTTQAPVFVGSVAPAVPVNGALWFNPDYGRLFMYYVDVDTSQWIEV